MNSSSNPSTTSEQKTHTDTTLASLAKPISEVYVSELSINISRFLKENEMDEGLYYSDKKLEKFSAYLSALAPTMKPHLFLSKVLKDPESVKTILGNLVIHYRFIRASSELEGLMSGYYFSADIPTPYGEDEKFNANQIPAALKALDRYRQIVQDSWEKSTNLLNTLLAPSIFYNIFYHPSERAMDFYLMLFDEPMITAAKKRLSQDLYPIYKGRTALSTDIIFTRFGRDEAFINSLLSSLRSAKEKDERSPFYANYLVYNVFRNNNLKHAQCCWAAASEENQKKLLEILSCRLGDIYPPALVLAYSHNNTEMTDWLWDLANTLELKKACLENLLNKGDRNPGFGSFFSSEKSNARYYKTAIDIIMKEKEHFTPLVENNNYELLLIAARIGKLKLVKKYLTTSNTPLKEEVFNQLKYLLNNASDHKESIMAALEKLNPTFKRSFMF